MHSVNHGLLIFWLSQSILALYQIKVPELEFISKNLRPIECARFYKLLRRQMPAEIAGNETPYRPRESPDCKSLLTSWLTDPKEPRDELHEHVNLILRQIGRTDLAHWLRYNVIHEKEFAESEKSCQQDTRGNMAVRYKGDDHPVQGSPPPPKLTPGETTPKQANSTQTVLQKVAITLAAILSMTTLCLCCYKFLYGRMRGGHFTNLRNEFDEESWLQQGRRQCGGGSGSHCTALPDARRSWRNSVDTLRQKPLPAIEYLKAKFKGLADNSRDKRSRQFRLLITRLQKTCPTQRKIIQLSGNERRLLRSLTDAEKHQLPATDSDLKFLVASDREKRKLLARECRREFLIGLRKRLERMGPDGNRNLTLNETERRLIRRLSSSERLLLPLMDRDLELLLSSPLQRRQVMLNQMAFKLAGIFPEDRKYLELDTVEKKFLKDIDEKERRKLDITDSEFRFLVASKSQRNVMQHRLESGERDRRVKIVRQRLAEVNYDVSRLELSTIEHSSFLSLNSYELARIGLTDEHVKFYAASDSERKVMWPSPSQHRNLRINTLQTKLSKLPWKSRSTRLTSSEHRLLASLTPREQDRLHISDSEKNFMLSTDSEKELIQRQRNIERLEAKIRDFNTVTMTESERGLILSLSPSELQMLNIDSTNKSYLIEKRSQRRLDSREAMIEALKDKIECRDRHAELTEVEKSLLRSLTGSEMTMLRMSPSQIHEILSNASGNNQNRRRMRLEMIKERIRREGLVNVRLTSSEKGLVGSLSNLEVDSCDVNPSQLSFLLRGESERRLNHQEPNHRYQAGTQCRGSATRRCASSGDLHMNTSAHVCHQQTKNPLNCHVHGHFNAHSSHDTRPNYTDNRHKVQFKEQGNWNNEGTAIVRDSTDDSEQSETYDELGMLFSQQMKQQARPCQRKYCLLGRHLRKGSQHDERQCQVRHHHCCRGYPSDQRPSCSSGNVCKDTYDEFQLMHARPHQKRELNSSMYERRKQFLDQPCQKCPNVRDYCMETN